MHESARPSASRGIFYIGIAATAWGTGGAVAAVLYSRSGLGAAAVSFWRFVGGFVLLGLAWPVIRDRKATSLYRQLRAAPTRLTLTGVGLALYQTAYFAAVGYAGVAIATVVCLGSGPVLVAIGARIWLDERLGVTGLLVVSSALAGLLLLVLGSGSNGSGSSSGLGIGLALLSAAGYAGTTLLSKVMSSPGSGTNPIGNAILGFGVGTLCLLPIALLQGIWPSRGNPLEVAGLLGYLGLVASAIAYGLFFVGLLSVQATTAAVVALVEPLTAALIGVFLLGERLGVAAVLGGLMLLGSVIFLGVQERRVPVAEAALIPD